MRWLSFSWLLLALTVILFDQRGLHAYDLVDIQQFNPKICVDLRYATNNNFLSLPVYPSHRIFVERYVATRLGRVQRELAKEGIGLIVLEGYRPPAVQWTIEQNCCKDCLERYSAEAAHYCKGLGVDVMPYYLDGLPINVPCFYQDNSLCASRDCMTLSANAYHNSCLLEKIMVNNGFIPQREKWWHFDLKGWECSPYLDVGYDELDNY